MKDFRILLYALYIGLLILNAVGYFNFSWWMILWCPLIGLISLTILVFVFLYIVGLMANKRLKKHRDSLNPKVRTFYDRD